MKFVKLHEAETNDEIFVNFECVFALRRTRTGVTFVHSSAHQAVAVKESIGKIREELSYILPPLSCTGLE